MSRRLFVTGLVGTVAVFAAVALAAFAIGQGQSQQAIEVRVIARQHEDGKIEFGVRHAGEDLLPRGRYFPAGGPGHSRWLQSTPVEIELLSATGTASDTGNSVAGTGPGLRTIRLEAGVYNCLLSVSNNVGSYGSGTNFIVALHDSENRTESLANEIEEEWSGHKRVVVGDGLFNLEPGLMDLDVSHAAQAAEWTVDCQRR